MVHKPKKFSAVEWNLLACLARQAAAVADARVRQGKYHFPTHVFRALAMLMPTVPLELAILDEKDRIFLVYRRDREYDGWHLPGSVILRGQSRGAKLAELMRREISPAGLSISRPRFIFSLESMEGADDQSEDTLGMDPRGQQESLVYLARLRRGKPRIGKFFLFDDLPENTLGHQRRLVEMVRTFLV